MIKEEDFVPENLEEEPDEDIKKILEYLENDPEFSKKLDDLVLQIGKSGGDLSKLHSQIILLLENAMKKVVVKNYIKRLLEKLDGNAESIKVKINKLGLYLIKNRTKYLQDFDMKDLADPEMSKLFLDSVVAKNLRNIMLRFMIYEAYKILNPRRIAGVTREQNYISNYIVRGARVADKYDKDMTKHLAKSNPKLLKNLAKKRKKFKKGEIGSGKLSVQNSKSSGTSFV